MKRPVKATLICLIIAATIGIGMYAYQGTKQDTPIEGQPDLAVHVYKTPTCGCCTKWLEHLQQENIQVTYTDVENVAPVKVQRDIEQQYWSCHTGLTANGYAFEGHVPAKYIKQFLNNPAEDAIGLSVPAMPVGSPGMEYKDQFMPYQVLLMKKDGTAEVYAEITSYPQQF
ncbi:MAG: DUF411 domain-containing protein [Limnobacter sp.]|nr:DUF411 domain-containing protein [Limnobacter sp.]